MGSQKVELQPISEPLGARVQRMECNSLCLKGTHALKDLTTESLSCISCNWHGNANSMSLEEFMLYSMYV